MADDQARQQARRLGLDLVIHNRQTSPIAYTGLPAVLSNYEYYIDVKRLPNGKLGTALSKTALEALACGCKVITYDECVVDELPDEHKPENVVKKVWEPYSSLAGG